MFLRHHISFCTMHGRLILPFIVTAIFLGSSLAPSKSVRAATTIVVTTTEHELNNDGDCSLREAITAANTDTVIDACPAGNGPDTIELEVDGSYVLDSEDNFGTYYTRGPFGLPIITSEITLHGNGSIIERHNSAPTFSFFAVAPGANLAISDTSLRGSYGGEGGAIANFGTATVLRCVFSNNKSGWGAAIYSDAWLGGGNTTAIDSEFIDSVGNALHQDAGGRMVLLNSLVQNNRATTDGGGISNDDGLLLISNSVITGNWGTDGGGVSVDDYGQLIIVNSILSGNKASRNGGALIVNDATNVTIANSVFSGNRAAVIAGGIFVRYYYLGSVTVNNSILWANSDEDGVAESSQISSEETPPTVLFSVIQDSDPNDGSIPFGGATNGNIDDDPLFVRNPDDGGDGWGVGNNDDYGDLHLQPNSPAIDAGENSLLPPDTADIDYDGDISEILPIDIDGDPRIFNGIVDMGADEFVHNDPPTSDAGGPYLVAKGQTVMLDGTGYDPESGILTYIWTPTDNLDDPSYADPLFTGSEVGVTPLTLTVTDPGDLSDSDTTYVVVYDPDGGFITGGGWIDSPAGAYMPEPNLYGKATFGFVSKYKKGADTPSGNTEFQFKAGSLNFHSDVYDWLVVAGAKAKFKGTGTINGEGNFGFMLSALDETQTPSTDVDRFHIKIWDKDNGDVVVYDNQLGDGDDADATTEIVGGNIIVHKSK